MPKSPDIEEVMHRANADPATFMADMAAVIIADSTLPYSVEEQYRRSPEGQAREALASLYQSFAEAVNSEKTDQARQLLTQAQELAKQYSIAWDSLPGGWKIFETKLSRLG